MPIPVPSPRSACDAAVDTGHSSSAPRRHGSHRTNRVPFLALLTAVAGACNESPQGLNGSPLLARDTVYIRPLFVDTVSPNQTPQLDGPVALDGTKLNDHGAWAYPGDTVILRSRSPLSLYEAIEDSIIVPDTVKRDSYSLRVYNPMVIVHRLIPTILRARWAADFTGPTVEVEIYAPNGIPGVRLTDVWVYWQACLNSDVFCETRITGSADRPPWGPDSSATGPRSWADLSAGWAYLGGRWAGWPSTLPPYGYGGTGASQAWQVTLGVSIEDDQGHRGHGACSSGFIPSDERELSCDVLFIR